MLQKEKINISFLNLAAQSPSLELNLAFSEKIHLENKKNKHLFFMCDSALKSCSVNVFNKKSICRICKYKAEKGFNEFKKRNINSELIRIRRSDLFKENLNNKNFDDNINKELLLGVHSTIGSQLRLDDMTLLDKKWRKVKNQMLKSSYGLFNYFDNFLSKNQVNNFIIFNGRLSCARPLIESSKKNNVNYNLFDAGVNGKVPMYSTNEMFHSIEFEKRNSFITYIKYFNESRDLAAKYFSYKRKKIPINDVAYTKNQIDNHIDDKIKKLNKPLISIFVSSDDEYRFIGSDWSKYKILDQIESIYELINSKLSEKYDFVVKMHPNQKSIHKSTMEKYKLLSNKVNVLFPENFTDSYALIEYSELVINFCSSIAVEANYLRKPVVQIGPSKFIKFSIANFVESTNEAIDLINEKKYKTMPIRGSIISFTYYMKSSFVLPAYKFIEDGLYTYGGVFLKTPLYMRLLAVPAKLYVHIIKGDTEIITNFGLYFKNLIFGITKVK
ncbi:hypothetical protein PQZ36_00765 [Flavobacteriaceae bacterium]|nr:hypothetical protein [Flavobacteriaceae bacterium]